MYVCLVATVVKGEATTMVDGCGTGQYEECSDGLGWIELVGLGVLGVVRYGIPYRECHTVYRTESYGMTKTIPIPYRKFRYTGVRYTGNSV